MGGDEVVDPVGGDVVGGVVVGEVLVDGFVELLDDGDVLDELLVGSVVDVVPVVDDEDDGDVVLSVLPVLVELLFGSVIDDDVELSLLL